jgi:hypoxanthine phosphoribosyltransferase
VIEAYEPYLGEILIDESTLQKRVRELGKQISDDYKGKDNILCLCVLKGGTVFLVDLMRQLTVPHEIDFMAISSYGAGVRESTGEVRIIMYLGRTIHNMHVLVVEDIIDTGRTMDYLWRLLQERGPASLRICALLNKSSRRQIPTPVDYVGFEIPNKFVFGYGLDLDEKFRNLPFIGVVKPEYVPK